MHEGVITPTGPLEGTPSVENGSPGKRTRKAYKDNVKVESSALIT